MANEKLDLAAIFFKEDMLTNVTVDVMKVYDKFVGFKCHNEINGCRYALAYVVMTYEKLINSLDLEGSNKIENMEKDVVYEFPYYNLYPDGLREITYGKQFIFDGEHYVVLGFDWASEILRPLGDDAEAPSIENDSYGFRPEGVFNYMNNHLK